MSTFNIKCLEGKRIQTCVDKAKVYFNAIFSFTLLLFTSCTRNGKLKLTVFFYFL